MINYPQFIMDCQKIMDNVESLITKYSFDDKQKNIIFMSLFEIARQHTKSIILLLEKKLYNSAGALVRSTIEASYRGLHVIYFLSDEDCENKKFDMNIQFPSLSQLAKNLDKKFGVNSFSDPKEINHLHDLTHNGKQQIYRMIDGNRIKSSYSQQDIVSILEASVKNILFLLVNIGIYFNDNDLKKEAETMLLDFNKQFTKKEN